MYITQSGDTFDIIAKRLYLNEKYIKELILANPNYANIVIFPNGINLNIPIIDTTEDTNTTTAPWR